MSLTEKDITAIEKSLRQAIQKNEIRLPAPPECYNKIAYAIENNMSLLQIEKIISVNPALAARVLLVANSSAYYGTEQSVSIQNALRKLGLSYVKNVILCVCVRDYYKISNPSLQLVASNTWKHSIHVAILAYVLSKSLDILSPDVALTCGLLHDVGTLPLIDYVNSNQALIPHWQELTCIIGGLGETVAREWNLGKELRSVMNFANGTETNLSQELSYRDLLGLIHIYLEMPENLSCYDLKFNISAEMIKTLELEYAVEIAALEKALG